MVNGMNTCSAQRAARSMMMSRRSCEAVMSRKMSSSAPSASYRAASSTGSPASRMADEVDALDHPPVAHVEARDDALAVHARRRQPAKIACASASVNDFS